jgi:hypothetical protein
MVPSYSSYRRIQPIEPGTPWWIFDDSCHDVPRSHRLLVLLNYIERIDLIRVEYEGSQIVNMSLDLLAFN